MHNRRSINHDIVKINEAAGYVVGVDEGKVEDWG
jgi:hypothetical protein